MNKRSTILGASLSNMPKVSVIIPTYNYGQYIDKSIDSVLSQTYTDFEIIVVDDGSTDNTKTIIETKYGSKVRYFYQKNKGAPAARNKGIAESVGEYLVFLDADDIFYPDNLEKKVDLLDKRKNDGFVYSDGYYVNEQSNKMAKSSSWLLSAAGEKLSGDIFLKLLEGYKIETIAAFFRRATIIDAEGFDEKLLCLQDYDLILRVSFNNTCSFIDECLFETLRHTGSVSSSTSTLNTYKSKSLIINKIERMYSHKAEALGAKWKKILAARYFFDGTIAYDVNDYESARKYFIRSIRIYPFQKRIYFSYMMTLTKKLLSKSN